MEILSPDEEKRLQSELSNGESLVWVGKPNPKVVFHSYDWYMIPMGCAIAAFTLLWEAAATGFFSRTPGKGAPIWFAAWGIPFILWGQYALWGRFFFVRWKKRRVLYAITNRRVLVQVMPPRAKTLSAFLENIPSIDKQVTPEGLGTLKFGQAVFFPWGNGGHNSTAMDGLYLNSGVPVFVDIHDVNSVYALVADLRAQNSRNL